MTEKKNTAKRVEEYDVVIIGAGVVGSAVFYALSKYTNINSVAIIEKEELAGQINSHHTKNSQTLHFGDIETNYSYEKAKKVKKAAERVAAFVEERGEYELYKKRHKMVLAVGDQEIKRLEKRYEEIKELFPKLRLVYRDEIAKLEPKVVEGRDPSQRLAALVNEDGYMINFQRLAQCFIGEAKAEQEESGKTVHTFFNHKVQSIQKQTRNGNTTYTIPTDRATLRGKVVVVAAGAHSLLMAQRLGIAREYGVLPVVGEWLCAQHLLNGKVYTLQIPKLPFAAVHGDPTVTNLDETRFGPTTKVLPVLERGRPSTFGDFLKTSNFSPAGVFTLLKIAADKDILLFMLKNIAYSLPLIGKRLYVKQVQKIVPTVAASDLTLSQGGLRAQSVNTKEKKLELGEARFTGENIIFNVTPSPGASVSLEEARKNAVDVADFLGDSVEFDTDRFDKDTQRE